MDEDEFRESEHERLYSYSLASDIPPLQSKEELQEDHDSWTDRIWHEYKKKYRKVPAQPAGKQYDFIFETGILEQVATSDRVSKSRTKYHEKWIKLQEKLLSNHQKSLLKYRDLPIPSLASPPTQESVCEFLLSGVEEGSRRKEIIKV
jgi:hypothetical protein